MFVTKLGHSCVLVETEDRVGLFDPGVWADQSLIENVKHIDKIIYTHEHGDHFDIDILKKLVDKFPNANAICNQEIARKIKDAGVNVLLREESACTRKFTSPHEQLPIPNSKPPAENGYHFKDIFTHPGDSQSFTETKKVLAMPFIGPWGKTGDSISKVIQLKPDYVLPIHDWHYHDEARQWLQGILDTSLSAYNIKLLSAENAVKHEIK